MPPWRQHPQQGCVVRSGHATLSTAVLRPGCRSAEASAAANGPLRELVRDLTQRCNDVWVVTGPLYLPQRAPIAAAGSLVTSCSTQCSVRCCYRACSHPKHCSRPCSGDALTRLHPEPLLPFSLCSASAGTLPQLMAVPTHFYKVVLGEFRRREGGQQAALGAFVMPNAPIEPDVPLAAFTVPLSALEEVAGR